MRALVALSARRLALLGGVRGIGALGRALVRARLTGIGSLRLGAGGSFPRRGGILSCSDGLGRGLVRRGPALSRRTLRAIGCSAAGTTGAMVFRGRRAFSSIGGLRELPTARPPQQKPPAPPQALRLRRVPPRHRPWASGRGDAGEAPGRRQGLQTRQRHLQRGPSLHLQQPFLRHQRPSWSSSRCCAT